VLNWRECLLEYMVHKLQQSHKLVGIGMGYHVKLFVHSSMQPIQLIGCGASAYKLWLVEGSHFGFFSGEHGGGRDIT